MKKNRILSLLLLLTLLLSGCALKDKFSLPTATSTPEPASASPSPTPEATPSPSPTPVPTPEPKPVSAAVQALLGRNEEVWQERQDAEWMAGRLIIPVAGIDVPLYTWGDEPAGETNTDRIIELVRQQVVDNENSALIYQDGLGNIIADHSNQDFASLSSVKVGDTAYILTGDSVISLRCDLVADGTNTGNGITDAEGNWFSANEDYFCYTCLENWTHVLVVGFCREDEDFFDKGGLAGDAAVSASSDAVDEFKTETETTAAPAPTATPAPTEAPAPTETPAPVVTAAPRQTEAPVVTYNPAWDYPPVPDDIYLDAYQNRGY